MAQQQQYSYGYGYQPTYAYPQAVTPTGYVGYAAPRPAYSPAPPAVPPPAPAPAPQQQPMQQPNVGYSPYNAAQSVPSNQPYATPQQVSSPATYGQGPKVGVAQVSPSVQYSQPQTPTYQNYSAYKPQTPSYTPYYENVKREPQTIPTSVTASQAVPASGTTTYVPTYTLTTSADSGGVVGYPSYTQTSYASAANAYYKQMKENKTMSTTTAQTGSYQSQQHTATSTTSSASLTPVQQQVVQQYIHQKSQGSNYMKKKTYTPPTNVQAHYCEVCKISCASALTYKTHLDGKSHKKKLNQQKLSDKDKANQAFYCELCDVVCSNKDGLEAHMRGVKHTKVVNLYKKMGKPIPVPKTSMPSGSTSGTAQTPVMVTAPRINFVGGKQLSSTGVGYKEVGVKVYPPPAQPTATEVAETTPTVEANGDETEAVADTPVTEDTEPEPVGEHLVIAVSGDPKFPHASFKCELCDCYFNDEFAKKAHVKGRRHRLNYKKTYQPSLYVEPTKSMKKEFEKKKKLRDQQREMIGELRRLASPQRGHGGRGRGGWRGGRGGGGYYSLGNYNSEWGGGDFGGMNLNERRRQETLEKARQEQMRREEEMYPPGPLHMGHAPPHMMGAMQPPRNPHDDKLVLSKHNAIYPVDGELTAVDGVVNDVEKTLKIISDDLLTEQCGGTKSKPGGEAKVVQKDESKRMLKGVMRVGAFARGLLLKGECNVELILMTATKPDISLFQVLDTRIPAKFEELNRTGAIKNIYNVTPNCTKAIFTIITQVEEYRIRVTVTLTSTTMREEPTPEQAKIDEAEGVLDRPSCLAALAALRHTKWFQAMAHNLPSCIIVMRVLKDICRRVPAWGVLDTWIMQLLVQKCIVSANSDFTKPGDVFRRVMECVASGLFLPGGTGLCDPCEKGIVDASVNLTAQERANISLSAQHALRLIAFDKLHLVLGVDPLPPPGEEGADEEGSVGTKRDATSIGASDNCKKIKLE